MRSGGWSGFCIVDSIMKFLTFNLNTTKDEKDNMDGSCYADIGHTYF
jgi:hypothetical protein